MKDIEELLIPNMESQPEVMDAAVAQDGDDISLVLIVGFATNESRAKEIGENFVRMTKSLMKDGAPGREIGKGKYNYLIGVYYPNENTVALGANRKNRRSTYMVNLGQYGEYRLITDIHLCNGEKWP